MTNRRPMTRHQKSTFVLTSAVTPVKWCGPPSGFIESAPPLCVPRREFAHSTVSLVKLAYFAAMSASPDIIASPRTVAGLVAERLRGSDRRRRAPVGHQAAPGRDRPALRREHHPGARGARRPAARGARAPAPAARRGGLRADRPGPARALRDPRGARGAGRGLHGRALPGALGGAAVHAARGDADRPARPGATWSSTSAFTPSSTRTASASASSR